MIFKRPYAFLIKYFKIINFILAFFFTYIGYKTYKIMNFFNEYVVNNYSGNFYKNFYIDYISPITILVFIIIIILISIVLWLLIFKKKPVKAYIAGIIYYFILLIFFIIVKDIMINMETNVITAELSRNYRDISLISLVPQLYFIITFILRGFGLNIQKFNFEKDIKELEVSSEDNEEVEITFKNDFVKLKRTTRRYFREFIYYLKENKFIVSILGVVIFILLIILIFSLFPKKIDSNYKQGNIFTYNSLTYSVKDSIITNLNTKGEKINNKYYVVTLLNIKNNSSDDKTLDFNGFRLLLDDSSIYPILDKGVNFVDYAKEYSGTLIKGNTDFDYSLVFEIDKKDIKNNYKIKFTTGSTVVDKKRVGKYNIITITPSVIDKVNIINTVELDNELFLINSNLGNTSIKVSNPIITNKYTYDYEDCYKDKCSTYKDIINLSYTKSDKTLLILDYEYNLDSNIPFSKTSNTIKGFINYFVKVKYEVDGKIYYSDVIGVTPSNLKDKIVLETTNKIKDAEKVYLNVTVRNREYLITIK